MISIPKIKEPPTTCTRYEGIHQLCVNINTAGPSAQHRCTTMPDQGTNTERRVEQLCIFALDGVLSEPYMPTRANSKAAKAVGRGGRRWV